MAPKLVLVEDNGVPRYGERPLIAEGVYRGVFLRSTTILMAMFGGAPKLFVDFRIVDAGEAFGLTLSRLYRVRALTSKPGRNGGARLGKRSELFLTLCRLTVAKLRPDRVSVKEVLRGRVLRLKVRTVKTDYRGRPLPPTQYFSVVDDVIGAETEELSEHMPCAVCSVPLETPTSPYEK